MSFSHQFIDQIRSRVDIESVWCGLGGGKLRGRRGQAWWRGGCGFSVSLDSKKQVWYDFRDNCGGDAFALVQTVRGCDFHEAAEWLAAHLGIPLNGAVASDDRAAGQSWAVDLRQAQLWRLAVVALAEAALAELPSWHRYRAPLTGLLRAVSLGDHSLVGEYRRWRCDDPKLTAALCHAGQLRDGASSAAWRCGYGEIAMARGQRNTTPITAEALEILNAPSPLEELNGDPMFRNVGIAWVYFRKRGRRIEGKTGTGRSVIWESAGDLLKFSKSEAIIADALGIVLPKPAKGRLSWRLVATLILQLAESDRLDIGDAVTIDLEELLQYAHAKAGFPCPNDAPRLVQVICDIRDYCRDARSETAPPCVFAYEGQVHVHQPSLRLWRSTPPGGNERLSASQIRQSLLAAGFVYDRNFRQQLEKTRYKLALWRGPLSSLGSDAVEIIEEES